MSHKSIELFELLEERSLLKSVIEFLKSSSPFSMMEVRVSLRMSDILVLELRMFIIEFELMSHIDLDICLYLL